MTHPSQLNPTNHSWRTQFAVVPAIDLKAGSVVRLRQGRMAQADEFGEPLEMAARFVAAGASRLHVVDLDGAVAGRAVHAQLIATLITHFPGLAVQVGGGIREIGTADAYLDAGAHAVILGTAAVHDEAFFAALCTRWPGQVLGAIDVRAGRVAVSGWVKDADAQLEPMGLAKRLVAQGAAGLIVTSIERDGMLCGADTTMAAAMAEAVAVPVWASGGVASVEDVARLARLGHLAGVVVGRALYEERLPLDILGRRGLDLARLS